MTHENEMGKIASFPRLGEFLEESSSLRLEEIRNPMLEHLDNLQIKMLHYFHSDFSKCAWIQDQGFIQAYATRQEARIFERIFF